MIDHVVNGGSVIGNLDVLINWETTFHWTQDGLFVLLGLLFILVVGVLLLLLLLLLGWLLWDIDIINKGKIDLIIWDKVDIVKIEMMMVGNQRVIQFTQITKVVWNMWDKIRINIDVTDHVVFLTMMMDVADVHIKILDVAHIKTCCWVDWIWD